MKRFGTFFNVIAAAAMTLVAAPSGVWAESNAPTGFFDATPEFDPNAPGTKYSGTLTIAYVFTDDNAGCPPPEFVGRRVSNMFVVFSLQHGNTVTPFNSDFRANPNTNPLVGKPETPSFCFFGDTQQIAFVLEMIRTRVVPSLYAPCVPRPTDPTQLIPMSCPEFKIKSVGNVLSSGHGSLRADITIAVRD
jgi:hypothetical protein